MPREIDCPCTYGPYSPKTIAGIKYCGNCKDGKIEVYTEAELNEAVKTERRELIRLITEVIILPPVPKKMLIEAIIARGK